jgi:uncharacterized protein (TIGR03579 family)
MEKLKKFLMKDETFPLLTALLGAAVFAGGCMYINEGFGLFADASQTALLIEGINEGNWATPVGYSAGFLLARVLEGPLVGILDIGGSMQTGVGTGMVALCQSLGLTWITGNFIVSILAGAIIGLVIGIVIIVVRKTMPGGLSAAGTDIMMGVGNAAGRYLGPLTVLSAISYSIPCGIGAIIGSCIMHKLDKPIIGGAILGAMIVGFFF